VNLKNYQVIEDDDAQVISQLSAEVADSSLEV
jgi:hypothetical protein